MTAILYVTANPNRASSNVPTEAWFQLLSPRGLRPVVVLGSDGAFAESTRSNGIPTYIVPLLFSDKRRPWRYAAMLWKLRRIVRQHSIELIHSVEHNVYPIVADLAKLCGLPVVVGVHCRIERQFGEWAFGGRRKPDRLFFLSKGSQEVCRTAVDGVVSSARWRLLSNGLNLQELRPDREAGRKFRELHELGNGLLIGAAAWLRPGKQIEHLISTMSAVHREDVTLVLAGGTAPGEEAYAQALLDGAIVQLGARLRFLGCLSDLSGFYNALDICINTSKEETCSISIIEALACGCPVIGYPSVSVDEQILPLGGDIVPQDDVEQLAAALKRWLSDADALAKRRAPARLQAEALFDIRKLADQLWREYESVLTERNGAIGRSNYATTELHNC